MEALRDKTVVLIPVIYHFACKGLLRVDKKTSRNVSIAAVYGARIRETDALMLQRRIG